MTRPRRTLLTTGAVAGFTMAFTVFLEIHYLSTLGWSQYGRYTLPGFAGVALLATMSQSGLGDLLERRLVRMATLSAGLLQLWVLAVEMTRVQAGPAAPVNPLAGAWHPLTGSWAPLVAESGGALLLALLAWTATSKRDRLVPGQGGGTSVPGTVQRVSSTETAPATVPALSVAEAVQ